MEAASEADLSQRLPVKREPTKVPRERHGRNPGHSWPGGCQSRSVTLRLVAPTDEIDAVFKSLVGPEVTVTDTRSWEPDGAGGYRGPLHVEAIANGRTATISGVLSLTPDGCSTSFTALADVSLKVRFIGGLAKGAVAALGIGSMEDQTKVLCRWLARMGLPA